MNQRKLNEKGGNISKKKSRIILLDSSVLMYVIKSRRGVKINLQEALLELSEGAELAVLETTVEELEFLRKKRKGKTRLAADFALEFIKNNRIHVIPVDSSIRENVLEKIKSKKDFYDEILVEIADLYGYAVATADLELIKKLRKRGITCYFPHGYKWFEVSGFQP